jgi:drug/metabolite transporter (DMT)-like permease
LAVIFHREIALINRQSFVDGAITGVFLWLGYEFQTTGLRLTSASKSAFITGLAVVLVPLFMVIGWRRRISAWTSIGVLFALFGLFLLTVPTAEGGVGNWTSVNRGDMLTLACAVSFGFQIIFLGRATEKNSFAQIGFMQIATAAVLMGVTVPLVEQSHMAWSSRVIWAILITGLLGTAAAFTIQAWAQQFISPTHTGLIFSLEPVFAWITSYIVLGERLGMRAGTGALLILGGVLVSELLGRERPLNTEVTEAVENVQNL